MKIVSPEQFRKLRESMKLTQAEMAIQMGVARNTVSRFEIGTRPITQSKGKLIKLLAMINKKGNV